MIHRFRRLRRLGIKLLNLRNPRTLRMTVHLSEFLHPCMPPRGMGILSMTYPGLAKSCGQWYNEMQSDCPMWEQAG